MDNTIRNILEDAARRVSKDGNGHKKSIEDECGQAEAEIRRLFPLDSFRQYVRVTHLALTPPGREVEAYISSLFDRRVRLCMRAELVPVYEGAQLVGSQWILTGKPYTVHRIQPTTMFKTDDCMAALGTAWSWTRELEGIPEGKE